MEATQMRDFKPKRINMETQHVTHPELSGGSGNTWNSAGTWHQEDKSNFHPRQDRLRPDLMEENAVLKVQLENSQFQEHLYYCKWKAAERKAWILKTQLEEVSTKYKYINGEAEATIKELKDQLEQARRNETRSYEEQIHELKFELKEAAVERINAANRLLLADKIMASLNLKLHDANKKLQQQKCNPAADQLEEDPALSTKAETNWRPGDERDNKCSERHTEQPEEMVEKLQEQLPMTQKELEQHPARHSEDQDAFSAEIEELGAKLSTSEALQENNEVKVLDLQEEVQKTTASCLTQLEQQKDDNAELIAVLKKAEEEKASLQPTVQTKRDEQTQRQIHMGARVDELESMVTKVEEKKSIKKKRCWLVRLLTRSAARQ